MHHIFKQPNSGLARFKDANYKLVFRSNIFQVGENWNSMFNQSPTTNKTSAVSLSLCFAIIHSFIDF